MDEGIYIRIVYCAQLDPWIKDDRVFFLAQIYVCLPNKLAAPIFKKVPNSFFPFYSSNAHSTLSWLTTRSPLQSRRREIIPHGFNFFSQGFETKSWIKQDATDSEKSKGDSMNVCPRYIDHNMVSY